MTILTPASWAAEPPSVSGAMEEILVSGEHPGPGVWSVSKGSHTLWVLATLVPLPRRMTWRSHDVERRIASSQVVLAPPEIVADVGFFDDPLYLSAVRRAEKNPNKGSLEQVLSPDLYSRWAAMRARFIGAPYDEHARPIIAARDLFEHMLERSGLTTDESVWRAVVKIAHRQHVKILPVVIELQMDGPDQWIKEFSQIPVDQELTCLEKTLARIETDVEPMRQRANLWAIGDVQGLLAATFPDERIACFNALFSIPRFHNQLADANRQLNAQWLSAADDALEHNESSFAVLPIAQLLGQDGWLAKLRARGYSVKDPDGQQYN
ncbi:MAG TPA: TraB/GumN family protein [Steroidobacteraceae bacterium]